MQGERKFLFELALQLHKSVGELEQMSSSELTEWMAFFNLRNKAEQSAQTQAAQINAMWANTRGQ